MENSTIESVILLSMAIIVFSFAYQQVFAETIEEHTFTTIIYDNGFLYNNRGETVKHWYLYVDNTLLQEGYNLSIGESIECSYVGTVVLTDGNEDILFYATI
jgi:hypothetical protein